MKRTRKTAMGIMGAGFGLGGGAMALGGMGGTAATNAATGLGNMSAALPVAGSIGGAGMVLGQVAGLREIMKRRR